MIKIDTASLLDDFESEARIHIDTIESAFLDLGVLADNGTLLDSIFRAAHSLKGTAGLLSLDHIVAVAHKLESIFSRIKDGDLRVSDEIADIVLQSVDYLKELTERLKAPDQVKAGALLERLGSYSDKTEGKEGLEEIEIPFDLQASGIAKILENARKHGHWIYYLNIEFNKNLGRYFERPQGLLDEIQSVGAIVKAAVNGVEPEGTGALSGDGILRELERREASSLGLLVTSILEPELFQVAVELEERFVHLIPEQPVFPKENRKMRKAEKERELLPQEVPVPAARKSDFSIRLTVTRINELMDLSNEMILIRNRLLAALPHRHVRSVDGLGGILQEMSRLTSEMQEKVMNSRMQPVSVVFAKFPRMIRDIAKSLHKDIRMEIFGEDVALDKYLLDSLSDPITQLIRNAAAHGIEEAARRQALGKPPTGLVTLRAYLRDEAAVIEVSDDGAGIDRETLKQKSLERGTLTAEQLGGMTKDTLLTLIFEPGLSTAPQVTSASGRGVGMDIVKTNIEKLGGSIEIESQPDAGTLLRLCVPLTLAVSRTLLVTIHSVLYAVPETDIERIVRISAATPLRRLAQIGNLPVLNLDGWILPVVTPEGIEARARGTEQSAQAFLEHVAERKAIKFLIMKTESRYFALFIEEAWETEEILVKPLPVYLKNCCCYSGVTVLGNGSTAVILDAKGILNFMGLDGAGKKETAEERTVVRDIRKFLVCSCAGEEYVALEMNRIARIERIASEEREQTPKEQVRILRLEEDIFNRQREEQQKEGYLLLLKGAASPTGLLVGKVRSQIEEIYPPPGDHSDNSNILSIGRYREKPLFFLNGANMMERWCGQSED